MLKLILILLTFSFYNTIFLFAYFGFLYFIRQKLRSESKQKYGSNTRVISFLHPFCNDCGGGEKVLWMIIKGMTMHLKSSEKIKINVLCGIKDDAVSIKNNLKHRFELDFSADDKSSVIDIELVRLKTAHLLKPKSFLTMFLQIVGQIIFAFEIVKTVHSDVIVDTTGLPFTYLVLRLLGRAKVVAYVHYPFISEDMISDIKRGVEGVHSRGIFGRIKPLRYFKVFYYYLILIFYKLNGLCVSFAFSNSSWTNNHIKKIWPGVNLVILYPPCATKLYESDSKLTRKNLIVSCAQFRPEKRQRMQIDIMKKLKARGFCKDLKLCITGATRDDSDRKLFDDLQEYIIKNDLENEVELKMNLSLGELKKIFETAKMGLHTMRDEHFGISIIEMMAAGLVTIAHRSAGPLNDIIGCAPHPVGLLADGKHICLFIIDVDDYADNIEEALKNYSGIYVNLTAGAKEWVEKFSHETFMGKFVML